MNRSLFCLISALLLYSYPAATQLINSNTLFTPTGFPGGSGLFNLSINPKNSNEIFASSDLGGIWYSNNFGKTWYILPGHEAIGSHKTHVNFTNIPGLLYANLVDPVKYWFYPAVSKDSGKTWDAIDPDTTIHDANFLYADPNDFKRIVLSTSNAILFSNDAGKTFHSVLNGLNQYIAGVYFDGNDIYIGSGRGLLVSEDGGLSFSKALIPGLDANLGFLSFTGAKKSSGELQLFGVARSSSTILASTIGADYRTATAYSIRIIKDAQNKLVAPWGSTSLDFYPFFIACATNNPQTIYISGASKEYIVPVIYKSMDGGASFSPIFHTDNNFNIKTGPSGAGGDFPWHWNETALGFAVSPTDANKVIMTDYSFMHGTDDGGDNWFAFYLDSNDLNPFGMTTPEKKFYRNNGLENSTVPTIFFVNAQRMLSGYSDLCACLSDDKGNSWQNKRADFGKYTSVQFKCNTAYRFIRHASTGFIYCVVSTVHDIYQSTHIDPISLEVPYAKSAIFISKDLGSTWEVIKEFEQAAVWIELDTNNPEVMYASVINHDTSIGGIYRTKNLSAGINTIWEKIPNPKEANGHPFNICVLPDGALFVTFSAFKEGTAFFNNNSGVFYLPANGTVWENRSHKSMQYWTKDAIVDPNDPTGNTWYVCVFNGWGNAYDSQEKIKFGGLYRTKNRGLSWEKIFDAYRVESVTIHPENSNLIFVTTEGEGLWVSNNGLDTMPLFTKITDYPASHPLRVFFNPNNLNEVWVSALGYGIAKGNLNEIFNTISLNELETPVKIRCYPNPFFDNIIFDLSDYTLSGDLTIKIFDLLGNLQITQSISDSRVMINGRSLRNGIYFWQAVDNGKTISTGKIIKIK